MLKKKKAKRVTQPLWAEVALLPGHSVLRQLGQLVLCARVSLAPFLQFSGIHMLWFVHVRLGGAGIFPSLMLLAVVIREFTWKQHRRQGPLCAGSYVGREGSGEGPEGARQHGRGRQHEDVLSNGPRRQAIDALPTGPSEEPQKTCLGHENSEHEGKT